MSDAEFFSAYWTWVAVAAAVVVVVAAVLIWILAIARTIAATAGRALAAVELIRQRTAAIPGLQDTNRLASTLLDGARSIRAHAETVADAVDHHDTPAGTGV